MMPQPYAINSENTRASCLDRMRLDATAQPICPICGGRDLRLFCTAPDRFLGGSTQYTLLRCACSFVWLHNPPPSHEMSNHYGMSYHEAITDSGEKRSSRRWSPHRRLLEGYKSSGSILDVGCSSGSFLRTLDSSRWKLFGIELDPFVAARARELTGATVRAGDVLTAKFPARSFDAITCFHFLEHAYDPRAVLKQLRIWLKPTGILCIALPNIESWEARALRSFWYALELPRHLSHFSKHSLLQLTADVGFEPLMMTTPPSSYIEPSIGYLVSSAMERFRSSPTRGYQAAELPMTLRIVRKAFRLSAMIILRHGTSWAGRSAEIHAVFRKTPAIGA